jgi:hypothetical protein
MLETLKQIVPATTRVAFIYNPDNPNTVVYRRTFEQFADAFYGADRVDLYRRAADMSTALYVAKKPATCLLNSHRNIL